MHAKPGYGAQILAILAMTENEFRNYFHELYPQLACYGAKLLGDNDVDDMLQVAFLEFWGSVLKPSCKLPPHAHNFISLYRKNGISVTPLNCALKALTFALKDSAFALVALLTKKLSMVS